MDYSLYLYRQYLPEALGDTERRHSHLRFVLALDKENKRELSVDAWPLLKSKNSGRNITFEEVVMRWGARPLKAGDLLVKKTDCDSGSFYVARHVWGEKYFLDNGKTVTLNTPLGNHWNGGGGEVSNGNRKVNTIKLDFKKSGTQALSTDYIIEVKSCEFKWNTTNNSGVNKKTLSVACKGGSDNKSSHSESVTLTLEESSFKS